MCSSDLALRAGRLGVSDFQRRMGFARADIPAEPGAADWALNLNRPEDHALAAALVEAHA